MTLTSEDGTISIDPDAETEKYNETLRLLSEGSVHKHFDPYVDIDWESPEFAVTANDRRWILPTKTDPIGGHAWYQALPEDRRSRSACGAKPTWPRSDCSSRTSSFAG
jgi:hypothetical protein